MNGQTLNISNVFNMVNLFQMGIALFSVQHIFILDYSHIHTLDKNNILITYD